MNHTHNEGFNNIQRISVLTGYMLSELWNKSKMNNAFCFISLSSQRFKHSYTPACKSKLLSYQFFKKMCFIFLKYWKTCFRIEKGSGLLKTSVSKPPMLYTASFRHEIQSIFPWILGLGDRTRHLNKTRWMYAMGSPLNYMCSYILEHSTWGLGSKLKVPLMERKL